MVNNRIAQLKETHQGISWKAISGLIYKELGVDLTPNACRKRYKRFTDNKSPNTQAVTQNPTQGNLGGLQAINKRFSPELLEMLLNMPDEEVKRLQAQHEKRQKEQNPVLRMNTDENILIIGDTHLPFTHPEYLPFCQRIAKKYDCTQFIHIGDVVDNHFSSFHQNSIYSDSVLNEYDNARLMMQEWIDAFPTLNGVLGNHDIIPQRKAKSAEIHPNALRGFEEFWGMPDGWKFYTSIIINNKILVAHGTGSSGIYHAFNMATKRAMMSVIAGHIHSSGGVYYKSTMNGGVIFGMNVGCGIDMDTYGMEYAKSDVSMQPNLGCGVLYQGTPIYEPMRL